MDTTTDIDSQTPTVWNFIVLWKYWSKYKFYIYVAIATKRFILPATKMKVHDQFIVFHGGLEFHEANVCGFGVMLEDI